MNSSGVTKAAQLTGYGSNVGFRGRYANGTLGSPTATTNGSIITFFSGRGYGATGFASAATGIINIAADATFTDTSMPTHMSFSVTPVGSVTNTEAMRIAPTGNVLMGTTADNGVDELQLGNSKGVSSNYIKFAGSTSGYAEFIAPSTIATPYSMSLPTGQGAASSYLQNDGSGNLSWTGGTPPVTTNNIDGGTSAALYTSPQIITGGTA